MKTNKIPYHFIFSLVLLVCFTLTSFPVLSFSFDRKELFNESSAEIEDDLHNSSTIVLRYIEKLNLPSESEDGISLKLFNDGYVTIYYPAYMKQSGHYSAHLDPAELDRLWGLLTNEHIIKFDEETVREQLLLEDHAQILESSILSRVTDAATIHLEIYLTNYKVINASVETKKLSWYGLKWDAKKYPENLAIQELALIQFELQSIIDRSDLIQIK